MDAYILTTIPRRSRAIKKLGNSGGLLTQKALLVDVPFRVDGRQAGSNRAFGFPG